MLSTWKASGIHKYTYSPYLRVSVRGDITNTVNKQLTKSALNPFL